MKLYKPILAPTILCVASNASALQLTCAKRYHALLGMNTLVAELEWTTFEEQTYPIGYMVTAATDPEGTDAMLGEYIFLPDVPGNERVHFLVWGLPGQYTLVSEAVSFGVEGFPPSVRWNPDPDDCGPIFRFLP